MKNVLIFVLLFTGILSYIFESRKPKPRPESEIRQALEEELARQFPSDPEPEASIPEPLDPTIDEQRETELRESLKAELAEELRKEITLEMQKMLPTPIPTPEDLITETIPPPSPVIVKKEPTATPDPGPDLNRMRAQLSEAEQRIAAMRKIIQQQDQLLSAEKSRIISWKSSVRNKYRDETFSSTKTRAELQQIQTAQNNWLSAQSRQNRRRAHLSNAEQDLALKKAYLNQVR